MIGSLEGGNGAFLDFTRWKEGGLGVGVGVRCRSERRGERI